jgi:hypothetical protein
MLSKLAKIKCGRNGSYASDLRLVRELLHLRIGLKLLAGNKVLTSTANTGISSAGLWSGTGRPTLTLTAGGPLSR